MPHLHTGVATPLLVDNEGYKDRTWQTFLIVRTGPEREILRSGANITIDISEIWDNSQLWTPPGRNCPDKEVLAGLIQDSNWKHLERFAPEFCKFKTIV